MDLQINDAVANNGIADPAAKQDEGFDHEVFLSFRGPDTRANFTQLLHDGLNDARIHAYKDDEDMRFGEEIGGELLQAIKRSKISIPIFSKGYASSKWCLKELVQMVECKKNTGQKIIPIFYDVEPSEVRRQTGGYGQAFIEHESEGRYSDETISEWKAALSEVGALRGWPLRSMPDRQEEDWVNTVVMVVFNELKKSRLALSDYLVEVVDDVNEIMRLIGPQTRETRIVGIHGMGGVGKTTLAKIIYDQLFPYFEHHCFLPDIQETWKVKGVEYLQNQLIFGILKRKEHIIDTDSGIEMIKKWLCCKRLVLLLDDVDKSDQLHALMGHNLFGEGSRVIITSRNKEVLSVPEVDQIYELKCMDSNKSLLLFSKHAFGREHPLDDYLADSKKAVGIAGGLPLALQVIGSHLSCQRKEIWDATLKKLEKVPHERVSDKLKVSYKALDDRQKHVFLDIACLLIGYDKEVAIHMWDENEFFPEEALEVLQNMSLITIDKNDKLWMHDLLRDMGREIVRNSDMVTERQTRAWYADEALNVLMTNQEKENVEALCLRLDIEAEQQRLSDDNFIRLPNLRFLLIYGKPSGNWSNYALVQSTLWQKFHPCINCFQKKSHLLPKLRWLSWPNISLDFDIAKLSMRNLVVLTLDGSHITHHWEGWGHIKMAKRLKVLDLSFCVRLVKTPDFSRLANLERLIMSACVSLVKVDKSIGQLQRLVFLDVSRCHRLSHLPNEIYELKSLKASKGLLTIGSGLESRTISSSPS